MAQVIESLDEITASYDAVLCDVWGVVHNGLRPFDDACKALARAIRNGKPVVLLTNSPRPASHVERQIKGIGVPRECWSLIVTSGDSARDALFSGEAGTKVYHVGPEAALGFFEPALGDEEHMTEIQRVGFDEAQGIVCTGLFDDMSETPEDYRTMLTEAARRKLPFLCANPDVIVDRGNTRVYCAGALAELFESLGGRTLMFGKPRARIYELAKRKLAPLLLESDGARILCIGDGITTDIRGAQNQSLDCLFVSGGLAARETGTVTQPDPAMLGRYLAAVGADPEYAIGFLR